MIHEITINADNLKEALKQPWDTKTCIVSDSLKIFGQVAACGRSGAMLKNEKTHISPLEEDDKIKWSTLQIAFDKVHGIGEGCLDEVKNLLPLTMQVNVFDV